MEHDVFNVVDVVAMLVIAAAFLMGLKRGVFAEFLRLINVALVSLAGLILYLPFGALLIANTRLQYDPEQARAVAFLLVVVFAGLGLIVARILFQLVAQIVFNEKGSRFGGGLIGIARGALIVALVVFGVNLWPNESLRQMFEKDSFTGRNVQAFSAPVVEKLERVSLTMETPAPEDE